MSQSFYAEQQIEKTARALNEQYTLNYLSKVAHKWKTSYNTS